MPDEATGAMGKLLQLPTKGRNKSNRVKYQCLGCEMQVWGKPELDILCGEDECGAEPLVAIT